MNRFYFFVILLIFTFGTINAEDKRNACGKFINKEDISLFTKKIINEDQNAPKLVVLCGKTKSEKLVLDKPIWLGEKIEIKTDGDDNCNQGEVLTGKNKYSVDILDELGTARNLKDFNCKSTRLFVRSFSRSAGTTARLYCLEPISDILTTQMVKDFNCISAYSQMDGHGTKAKWGAWTDCKLAQLTPQDTADKVNEGPLKKAMFYIADRTCHLYESTALEKFAAKPNNK